MLIKREFDKKINSKYLNLHLLRISFSQHLKFSASKKNYKLKIILMHKKLLLGLFAAICLLGSCASKGYKISGQLTNSATGEVYLGKITVDGLMPIDTTRLVDGNFNFDGSVEFPEVYVIRFEKYQDYIMLFLENTNISVKGDVDKLPEAQIKGSRLNDIFTKFNDEMPHKAEIEKMNNDFMRAQQQGDETTMQSIMADAEKINKDREKYFIDFIKANTNNAMGAYLALSAIQMLSFEDIEQIMPELNANLPNHPYVTGLSEAYEQISQYREMEAKMEAAKASLGIGKEAPLFTLSDINGKEVSLESFRGKYVFIDFWASWCMPCRYENPNLIEAYKKYGGAKFEIISVSLDKTVEPWLKAVEEDGLNWTLLHDPTGNSATLYAVETIPSTWLLDKEGKIIKTNLRGAELEQTLAELLK